MKYNQQQKLILSSLTMDELDIAWAMMDYAMSEADELGRVALDMQAIEPTVDRHRNLHAYATAASAFLANILNQLSKVDTRVRGVSIEDPYRDEELARQRAENAECQG